MFIKKPPRFSVVLLIIIIYYHPSRPSLFIIISESAYWPHCTYTMHTHGICFGRISMVNCVQLDQESILSIIQHIQYENKNKPEYVT